MTDKTLSVRLEPREQDMVKDIARRRGTTVVALLTEVVEQYAAGPLPPPRRPGVPLGDMRQNKLVLPAATIERAKKRASREGVILSDAIYQEAVVASMTEPVDA